MKICNCTAKLAFLAIVAAGLLAVPPEKSQAQEPENFAWITNTDGLKWKKKIYLAADVSKHVTDIFNKGILISTSIEEEIQRIWLVLHFDPSEKQEVAQIVIPEHVNFRSINVNGCVNLTNLVIHGDFINEDFILYIEARNSGLSNITCTKAMRTIIRLDLGDNGKGRQPIQWTEIEPHKIKIKMHTTDYGHGSGSHLERR